MAKWKAYKSKNKSTYSDGEIENVIYEYVKNNVDIKTLPIQEITYPIVYHLSEIRENILNWYPFNKNATILEVGAGCGAITGMLCKRAKKVVSVDISLRRSKINYTRNKKYENLDVIVGNVNEIEFQESFDYIILNGVLEYAAMFTEGQTPYQTFLKQLKSHLKQDGKFLIAIENKLGVKYFAGSPEDHTNEYFTGLNGYKNCSVKTFTQKELEQLLLACGMEKIKFYYPYPDYKFPEEIFTTDSIEQYGKRTVTYLQENHFQLFDIKEICRTFIKEGIMEKFANSFLVEATDANAFLENDILYVKVNQDRKEDYRICTSIIKNTQGFSYVVKKALNEKANKHIENMVAVEENTRIIFQYLTGVYEKEENEIWYPYVNEQNLDTEIRSIIDREDFTKEDKKVRIFYILDHFIEFCKTSCVFVENFMTKKFCEVFGNEIYEQGDICMFPANIDFILNNVYWKDGKYIIIDPEWIFDFPIPVDFIIWRMLNELYTSNEKLSEIIDNGYVMKRYGILEQNKISTYIKWANHFVNYYLEGDKMKQWNKSIIPYDLYHCVEKVLGKQTVMILYYSYGDGFKEEQKIVSEIRIVNQIFKVEFSLKEIQAVEFRFDPAICACKCRLKRVETNIGKAEVKINDITKEIVENDYKVEEWYEFFTDDPQYNIHLSDSNIEKIYIEGELILLSKENKEVSQ